MNRRTFFSSLIGIRAAFRRWKFDRDVKRYLRTSIPLADHIFTTSPLFPRLLEHGVEESFSGGSEIKDNFIYGDDHRWE